MGTSVKITPDMRQTVIDMASQGKELFSIAKELGITKRMLVYRCRKEIDEGRELAVMNGVPLPKSAHLASTREEVPEETRYQIEMMAAFGLPIDQICTVVGMARMTMLAYCQEDIDRGRARGHEAVAGQLYDMATDGEHPLQTQFYLKHKCGWKETPTGIEFPDADGNPQKISNDQNGMSITKEALLSIIEMLNEKV